MNFLKCVEGFLFGTTHIESWGQQDELYMRIQSYAYMFSCCFHSSGFPLMDKNAYRSDHRAIDIETPTHTHTRSTGKRVRLDGIENSVALFTRHA